MMIYGSEEMISRLISMRETDAHIHEVLNHCEYVSNIQTLRGSNLNGEILVLDSSDTEILKFLFQNHCTDVCFPVCGTILSVRDPDSDHILNEKLKNCTNWRWHKEANRFRMLQGYLLRNPVTRSLPIHIQLEHTSYCNARCIMCGHAIYGNTGAMHISDRMIERMQSLLPSCEVMILHGYGEPLMTRGLEDLLEMYRSYEIEVTTNSNLSYLPDNLLKQLISVMEHLHISCDGVTKEVYEGIRPGLNFDTFLKNLEKLRTQAPDMDLTMEAVIMRQNVEQLPQMVQFAHDWGCSQISLNRLGSHPVLNNDRDCLHHYPNLTSVYLRQAAELGERLGISVCYPREWLLDTPSPEVAQQERIRAGQLPFQAEPLFVPKEQRRMVYNAVPLSADDPELRPGIYTCDGMCDSLLGRTNIDLQGNIYVCCMNTMKKTGNLFELADDELYNTPAQVKMREMFYAGEVPAYCDRCSYVMNRTLALASVKQK
ncbi:MAG: radical SAM protein [Clostridiales bacterium]|nr:radical SAM protein [Clostridiales bacterium]